MGKKCSDWLCWPACRTCHEDKHAARGAFRGLSRDQRRAWLLERVWGAWRRFARQSLDGSAISF
jgi:hypothetical protein